MITDVLNSIDSFVWGPPLLVLLIGTGLMLTIRLQLIQFFKLPQALKLILTALRLCVRPWRPLSGPVILSA